MSYFSWTFFFLKKMAAIEVEYSIASVTQYSEKKKMNGSRY